MTVANLRQHDTEDGRQATSSERYNPDFHLEKEDAEGVGCSG